MNAMDPAAKYDAAAMNIETLKNQMTLTTLTAKQIGASFIDSSTIRYTSSR
jgi:hypothetical protein